MRRVNVTKRVLQILDLVDSDPYVDGLESSCFKAPDVSSRAHIVFIALHDLQLVILLQVWT